MAPSVFEVLPCAAPAGSRNRYALCNTLGVFVICGLGIGHSWRLRTITSVIPSSRASALPVRMSGSAKRISKNWMTYFTSALRGEIGMSGPKPTGCYKKWNH
jgi:hypothetical protein